MSSGAPVIKIDFLGDWKAILETRLTAMGYSLNPSDDLDAVALKYFNAMSRRIRQASRAVHEAREFACPPTVASDYAKLKAAFHAGDDVNLYLSTTMAELDYDDMMLNDWGIYHFHVGPGRPAKVAGYSDRTSLLLYAYVTSSDVYCINFLPHNHWSDSQLLRIIHNNWPQAIARYRQSNMTGLSYKGTDEERLERRKHGILSFIEVEPGVFYYPPGGGYASSGTSIRAVISANYYKRWIGDMEQHVREKCQWYLDQIAATGTEPAKPSHFKLEVVGDFLVVAETGAAVSFRLAPHQLVG